MKHGILRLFRLLLPIVVIGGPVMRIASAATLDHSSSAIAAIAGDWILAPENSKVECTIKLNDKPTKDALLVGVPATCRKPIRAVTPVVAWALTETGQILLLGSRSETLFAFTRKSDGVYAAKPAEDGPEFLMRPVGGRYDASQRIRAVDSAIANVVAPQANANIPAGEAGHYQILRAGDKNTGCSLLLDIRPGPKQDLGRAVLEGGCEDKGLKLFDPVGWHVENRDRLFLVARKGHSFGFNKERFGWTKDPVKGSPLKLVKQ